mgnify:CR=1 FL=1
MAVPRAQVASLAADTLRQVVTNNRQLIRRQLAAASGSSGAVPPTAATAAQPGEGSGDFYGAVSPLLLELAGSYVEEAPRSLMNSNPDFFRQFTLVIATQVLLGCVCVLLCGGCMVATPALAGMAA